MRSSAGRLGIDAAGDMASLIRENGCTVWIGADGDATDGEVDSVTAIVDERINEARRIFPDEIIQERGRVALFYVSEADYQKIGRGETLVYDRLKWTHLQTRSQQAGNVVTVRILLCTTGGTL